MFRIAELENSLKEKESEKSAEIENLQRRNSELETKLEEREKKIGLQFDSTEAKFYLMWFWALLLISHNYSTYYLFAVYCYRENELAEKDIKVQQLNRELEEHRIEMNNIQSRLNQSNADVNVNGPDSDLDSFRKIIDDAKLR